MMPIQTSEGVRLEVSNSVGDEFVNYHLRITASGKCCCGKGFTEWASLPDKLIEDLEVAGVLANALVDLVVKSRNDHLSECDR